MPLAVGGGLAAAVWLAVAVIRHDDRPIEAERSNGAKLDPALAFNDALPTVLVYSRVLARAPEELDAQLDRPAAAVLQPDPDGVCLHAFSRSDVDFHFHEGER